MDMGLGCELDCDGVGTGFCQSYVTPSLAKTGKQALIRYHSHHRPQFSVQYVNRHVSVLKCYVEDRTPPPPPHPKHSNGWVGGHLPLSGWNEFNRLFNKEGAEHETQVTCTQGAVVI